MLHETAVRTLWELSLHRLCSHGHKRTIGYVLWEPDYELRVGPQICFVVLLPFLLVMAICFVETLFYYQRKVH